MLYFDEQGTLTDDQLQTLEEWIKDHPLCPGCGNYRKLTQGACEECWHEMYKEDK